MIFTMEQKRDSLSFWEFESIDLEKHKNMTCGYWQEDEAYDLCMFARYAKDLFFLGTSSMEKEKYSCNRRVHKEIST